MSQFATGTLPKHHPVYSLEGFARHLALPKESGPTRLPSFPSLERTAVIGFNAPTSLLVPANSERKLLLCRSPVWPAWGGYSLNGAGYGVTWNTGQQPNNVSVPGGYTIAGGFSDWFVTNRLASGVQTGIAGIVTPTFNYPIVGTDLATGPVPYMLIPENWDATVMCGYMSSVLGASAVSIQISWEVWRSPGEVLQPTIAATSTLTHTAGQTAASGSMPSSLKGQWVRPFEVNISGGLTAGGTVFQITLLTAAGTIAYAGAAATPGIATVTPAVRTGLLPLCSPSEFANSALPWYSTRVTAAALLATNVTPILDKAGTMLGGRVAPEIINPFTVDSGYLNNIHPMEKAWLPLETGVYTYCPPSGSLLDFVDCTITTITDSEVVNLFAQVKPCPSFELGNKSFYNVMFFTAGSKDETFAMNITWQLEFRTMSSLFDLDICRGTLDTLHRAQIALSEAGYYFDNPDHKKILMKVLGAVKAYGPEAVSMVHPTVGQVLKMIRSAVEEKEKAQHEGVKSDKKEKQEKAPVPAQDKAKGKKKT